MKTVRDIDLRNKRVVLRADYNVPLDKGRITDNYRILQALPTLEYLLAQDCRVVIISHLGRPDGQRNPEYSMRPVAQHLQDLTGRSVALANDIEAVDTVRDQITLLENLRYWPEEMANDKNFAGQLAGLGEVFVQDGFGVVHRPHASTAAITEYLPSVAGLLVAREIEIITQAMDNPARPLVAIFGGAKISDKIGVIERFIDRADKILIGGAMANTFFAYEGLGVGKSLKETDQTQVIDKLLENIAIKDNGGNETGRHPDKGSEGLAAQDTLELPIDVAVAKAIDSDQPRITVEKDAVGDDDYILDIGPKTVARYQKIVSEAATVIWNGPLGYTELERFAVGSNHIAATLKEHNQSVKSIIGGGDTSGFIVQWDEDNGESFFHVSTGGGAALDLMAGKELPGIVSLQG